MDRAFFNSSVTRDDYAIIKDEAYKLGISVKKHISNIIHEYTEQKRKEEAATEKGSKA